MDSRGEFTDGKPDLGLSLTSTEITAFDGSSYRYGLHSFKVCFMTQLAFVGKESVLIHGISPICRMTAQYEDLTERLEGFDSSSSKQEQEEVLEKLKETHATSAGLKAFCTVSSLQMTIESPPI